MRGRACVCVLIYSGCVADVELGSKDGEDKKQTAKSRRDIEREEEEQEEEKYLEEQLGDRKSQVEVSSRGGRGEGPQTDGRSGRERGNMQRENTERDSGQRQPRLPEQNGGGTTQEEEKTQVVTACRAGILYTKGIRADITFCISLRVPW